MSTHVVPAAPAATVHLDPARLETLPLDAEVWLADALALRLGPPQCHSAPPWPRTGAAPVARARAGVVLDRRIALLAGLAVLVLALAVLASPPAGPARPAARPAPSVAPVAIVAAPTRPLPAPPTAPARPTPAPALTATPVPVPAALPTAVPATLAPAPTAIPPVRRVPPPAVVAPTAVPVPPTTVPVPPTAVPVPPSPTAWWPDLGPPTRKPARPITPTPGSGDAGNDWSDAIFQRSAGIGAPSPTAGGTP